MKMNCSAAKATFEIITGSYEEYLLGYFFASEQSEIIQSFAAHEHINSIRSVTVCGQYLASGASDDRIFIYDLKTRKEHCMLTHHESTVTCLQFTPNHTHLLSGSSDGVLAIVRVGNWQVEKIWEKAHKGAAIIDIAVHSSGKLALTLGSDCTLRTWNLIKGRQAYAINLNSKSSDAKSLEKIVWAPDGVKFLLYGGKVTEIWSIEAGGQLSVVEHEQKVSSALWMTDETLLVGYEDGKIAVVDVNGDQKNEYKAHSGRVKALALYKKWIVSASSSGEIKVWNEELDELAKLDTGCRLTCVCIAPITIKKEDNSDKTAEECPANSANKMESVSQVRSVVIEVEGSDDDVIVEEKKVKKRKSAFIVEEIGTPTLKAKISKKKNKKQSSLKKRKASSKT